MVMKIDHSDLNVLVKQLYPKQTSLIVYGSFGVGKSFVIRDTAEELSTENKREFIEWAKTSKEEKQLVYANPEKFFVIVDVRLSEYDSCLTGDMEVSLVNGKYKPIKDIEKWDIIMGYKDNKLVTNKVIKKWNKGMSKEGIINIHLTNGKIIKATKKHKFLTNKGWVETNDLNTSHILYSKILKENNNGKQRKTIHQKGQRLYYKKLEEENSKGNSKNIKENCKINRRTSIQITNKEKTSELYNKRKKSNQTTIPKNEGERFSKNDGEKQEWNKHSGKRHGSTKNLCFSDERKRNKFGQYEHSRKGLHCRNNRWRRNNNLGDTKILQKCKSRWCNIQTKINNLQYRQKPIRMVFKTNENKSGDLGNKKNKISQNTIHNRDEWLQNSTNTKNINSIFSNKKGTMSITSIMDRKKKNKKMERPLLSNRQKTTFTNKKNEFEQMGIQKIDYTNKNRQIFDLTTTTSNYLVNNVICHNSDMKGIPKLDSSDYLDWKIPLWELLLQKEKSMGVLFLDEFNLASPMVLSSTYKILNDRTIGDGKIVDGWSIIGAGNLASDKAFTFDLPLPLRDRCCECELQTADTDSFTEYMVRKNFMKEIIAFINAHSSVMREVASGDSKLKNTTTRGWERLNNLVKERKDIDKEFELLTHTSIGEGIASDFVAFCKIQKKLNIEEYIKNPSKIMDIKGDEALSLKYFLITCVADQYKDKKLDFKKVMEISKVFDKENKAEYVTLMWQLCISYNEEMFRKDVLGSSGDEETLISKYGNYLF